MHSIAQHSRHLLFPLIATALLTGTAIPNAARADTLTVIPGTGIQCKGIAVNDVGITVGTCQNSSQGSAQSIWSAALNANRVALPTPTGYTFCEDPKIADNGEIIANCTGSDGNTNGFRWVPNADGQYSTPIKLRPTTIAGLLADTSDYVHGININGDVIGESYDASGAHTAEVYPAGNDTPVDISSHDDNCSPGDLNAIYTNGFPSVVLKCPVTLNGSIKEQPYEALPTKLLGIVSYTKTPLIIPADSLRCDGYAVNNSGAAIGTCFYSQAPTERAVYWSSASAQPQVLNNSLPTNPVDGSPRSGDKTSSKLMNNQGDIVVVDKDANSGKGDDLLWDPANNEIWTINPVPNGARVNMNSLAKNASVAVGSCETSSETLVACKWTPSGGTVILSNTSSGASSELISLSPNGQYAVGHEQDSNQNYVPVLVTAN